MYVQMFQQKKSINGLWPNICRPERVHLDESPLIAKTIECEANAHSSCYHNHAFSWTEKGIYFSCEARGITGSLRSYNSISLFYRWVPKLHQSSLADLQSGLKCLVQKNSSLLLPFQNHHVFSRKKRQRSMQRGISTHDHCHYWQFSTLMLWGIGANELRCEARMTSLPVFQTAQSPA